MTEADRTDVDRLADLQRRTKAHLDRLAATEAEERALGAEIDGHLSRRRLLPEAEVLISGSAQTACPGPHDAWAQMDRGALQPDRRPRPPLGRYFCCRKCHQHFLRKNRRPARWRARRIEAALRLRLAQLLPVAGMQPGAALYYRLTPGGLGQAGCALVELRAVRGDFVASADFDPDLRTFLILWATARPLSEGDLDGWRRWGEAAPAHPHAEALVRAREAYCPPTFAAGLGVVIEQLSAVAARIHDQAPEAPGPHPDDLTILKNCGEALSRAAAEVSRGG